MRSFFPAAACVVLAAWTAAAAERAPRYAALLASGQRLEGHKLSDWHDAKAMPRLDGQPLLEAANPLRWLRDRWQRPAELPLAYVEMTNGDRLPGTVIDYRTGQEQPLDPQPAHFIIRPSVIFEPPENRPAGDVRVAAACVRRIVWQRRGTAEQQPGTAFYRDGRSLAFRAARFHPGEAHLLTESGDERLPWSDLAELHLPAEDPWAAHFDQLAALCPASDTRLIEIETAGGLVATASLARLAARFEGNSSDSDRWAHGVQPAWSLDILWIPFREIAYYRSFAPRELPLSRLPARLRLQSSGLAGRRPVAINRSAAGTPLASKSLDFGFGLGTSGGELAFDLTAAARSLRTLVCLDRTAGSGGCIRPRIFAGEAKGNPLWQGPILVGSEQVADSGAIPLGGHKAIVLQIDPVTSARPAGADPLDIRDLANWCDPLLELDPPAVQAELDRRLGQRFVAWRSWQASIEGGTTAEAGLETTFFRDDRRPPPGEFLAAVQVKQRPLVLRRELMVGPRDEWLLIAATRPINRGQEPKLEVKVGGEAVAELLVPQRQGDPNDNRPLAVSLAGYAADPPRKIAVEIRQQAATDSAPVHWRAIAVSEQLPTLFRVFEEQTTLAAAIADQSGTAAIDAGERHYGARSIRVTPAGRFRIELPAAMPIRERPLWGEARFIRFAVKKQGGGRVAVELEDAQFRETPARYDLGPGQPSYGAATRIWQDNLPKDWVVLTRDLFADFGQLDMRAIIVGAPDGEAAFLDHVYLARNPSDFDLIPAAPSAELVNEKARQELLQPLIARAAPAVVRIEFADGRRAAGVFIQEAGEILTAGHAVLVAGEQCRVVLAHGDEVLGRTLGVAREFDLGLLRVVSEGRYPHLNAHGPAELPQNQPYLGIVVGRASPARSSLARIRRVFHNTVWTDLDAADWLAGGPLLDREGRLVAVQVAKSEFGGILCSRLQHAWPQLGRMRNGERFGAWPAGSEPEAGIDAAIEDGVFRIRQVLSGGPAASAGLAIGDAIQKIDGRPIGSESDLQRALAERDAGQEITVEYARGKEARQAKLKLVPRVP